MYKFCYMINDFYFVYYLFYDFDCWNYYLSCYFVVNQIDYYVVMIVVVLIVLVDDMIDQFCFDLVFVCYFLKSYFYLNQIVDYYLGIDGSQVVVLVVQYLIDYCCYSYYLLVEFGFGVDQYYDFDLKYYFVCFCDCVLFFYYFYQNQYGG